ncbi:MAG: hypothetical protein WD875_03940 [Pirellulales bacterium]
MGDHRGNKRMADREKAACSDFSTSSALATLHAYSSVKGTGTPVVYSWAIRAFASSPAVRPILTIFGIAGFDIT